MKLPIGAKILLTLVCFGIAIYGFMLKLPASLRGMDRELHAVFYFLAAAFLTILFTQKKLIGHILIIGGLYLFGAGIEYAQEYSNTYLHKRIHGRFDPVDLQYNLKGLIAFSIVWIIYVALSFAFSKGRVKEVKKEKLKTSTDHSIY